MLSEPPASASGEVRELLGRGSVYTLGTLVQALAAIAVVPAATRLLTAHWYGELATALVVLQVLIYLVPLGVYSSITLEFFGTDGGSDRARSLVVMTAATALPVTLLLHVTGTFWAKPLLGLPYDMTLALVVWTAPVWAVLIAAQGVMRAQRKARAYLATSLTATAGGQIAGLVWVLVGPRTSSSYLAGVCAGMGIGTFAAVAVAGVDFRPIRSARLWRSALSFGLPTVPHLVAIYVVAAADRIIVERLRGLETVARYQVAYIVGALGLTLIGAVGNAWAPLIYGSDDDYRWHVLAETNAALWRLTAIVCSGIALGAPLLLVILAPHSYDIESLTPVSAIVSISALAYLAYLTSVAVVFVRRRTWWLAVLTPCSAAVNVGLNLWLVPVFGLIGAAVATVIAYAFQAMLVWSVGARKEPIPFNWNQLGLQMLAAAAVVVVGALLPITGLWLVVRTVLTAAAIAVFGWSVKSLLRLRPPVETVTPLQG